MKRSENLLGHFSALSPEKVKQWAALAFLILLGVAAFAGPTGLLAWYDSEALLKERNAQIASLTEDRDMLRHRVEMLDPQGADPDLVAELLRDLDLVHPDELVITLEDSE